MKIRVLIVDDSPLIRAVLREAFEHTEDIEVIGEAGNGNEAILEVKRLLPDVVTMDILMPGMDGLKATREIMLHHPIPIVIVARDGGDAKRFAFEALEQGALEIFPKPNTGFDEYAANELARVVRRLGHQAQRMDPRAQAKINSSPIVERAFDVSVVGIGGSTGAPQVLHSLLHALPKDFPVPIVAVQHTQPDFGHALFHWLSEASSLPIHLGKEGHVLKSGEVVLAPPDCHMEVDRGGLIRLHNGPPESGVRPSATVLFRSLANHFGAEALGLILSGTGNDGSEGLGAIYSAGGTAVVESPATAAVAIAPERALAYAAGAYVAKASRLPQLLMELVAAGRSLSS